MDGDAGEEAELGRVSTARVSRVRLLHQHQQSDDAEEHHHQQSDDAAEEHQHQQRKEPTAREPMRRTARSTTAAPRAGVDLLLLDLLLLGRVSTCCSLGGCRRRGAARIEGRRRGAAQIETVARVRSDLGADRKGGRRGRRLGRPHLIVSEAYSLRVRLR
jgi:hypothetical protein